MSENEKERPAASGIEEIFSNVPNERKTAREERAGISDGAESAKGFDEPKNADGTAKRRERNRRRNKRRSRVQKSEEGNGDAGSESSASGGAGTNGYDEELIDNDPNDEGVGGFGDLPAYTELVMTTRGPETVEVVGVRFNDTGKTYYFAPCGRPFAKGVHVVVDTSRGLEYGCVSVPNSFVPVSSIVPPLRNVIRAATKEDDEKQKDNLEKEKESFGICLEKIREHGLDMKLIDAEYTFDQTKLTFYFSADGRVDFRELVKDLAGVFRTRIELRQIGIRDEAKLVGGLGVCGRPFCCSTFLTDFVQVSIKMAKEQNLSLNSAKISGACGRLMCCLRYEHETYAEEIKKTPPVGCRVKTSDGTGVVVETAPLLGTVKVRLGDEGSQTVREFHRDEVTPLSKTAIPTETETDDETEGE